MAGLSLITSNRMDVLVEQLAALMREPAGPPLCPETIVIQSRGMERWVSMELARRNGISANLRFPFPNAFLESAFRAVCPELPGESPFEPSVLAFRIMARLAPHLERPEFAPLRRFLENDPRAAKLSQMSHRLADLFDQYLVYRPDMMERWEHGRIAPEERAFQWQALLWGDLARTAGAPHRVRLRRLLAAAVNARAEGVSALPQRVCLFGISYLPRFHLELLAALSRVVPITLFSANPCREYWADIVSAAEAGAIGRRRGRAGLPASGLHLEQGNPLLAAWGRLGREFLDAVTEAAVEQTERFVDPGNDSLLARVQSDILNLREPAPAPGVKPDGSIRVHACHSPMREVEVLHDQLLAMFEEDPGLQPRDVIVMTPDIEAYAPFISAVFGAQSDPRRRIPFSIADRSPQRESGQLRAFFSLLDLRDSRLEASEILKLLESPSIRGKFKLEEARHAQLEHWLRQAQVRWGKDETTARDLGLPGQAANTWRAGIERLLLGYALPPSGTEVFQGVRGCDAVEGSDVRQLGCFLEFLECVFALADSLRTPRRLSEWQVELTRAAEAFFPEVEDYEPGLLHLQRLLSQLAQMERSSGFSAAVPIEVVRAFLSERMEAEGAGRGFLSGGITFCAMLPMRAIPFAVVCLIGMNHDAFPREDHRLTFDLMAQTPRPGDRSRRSDDKYLFLEALTAAGRRFNISHVGLSIQDNSPIPPSVVVNDLLDALQRGYGIALEEGIVTRHRLQAFAPDYFRLPSALFSYSREDLRACSAAAGPKRAPAFFPAPVPLSPAEQQRWTQTDIERLAAFFANPAKCLLRERLGIQLDLPPPEAGDREPFTLKGRERFEVGQRLLEHRLAGGLPQPVFAELRAAGRLPHGTVGEVAVEDLWAEADRFARRLEPLLPAGAVQTVAARWEMSGICLSARLAGVRAGGCLRYRFGKLRARDVIALWLQHLVLCLAADGDPACVSVMVGTDQTLRLAPSAQSRTALEELLRLYRQGIEAPLAFFPNSSLAYAQAASRSDARALAAARSVWEGSDRQPGEGTDPYYMRCFETLDPLGDEFVRLSRRVFDPLLACAVFEKA
ncbi:MAG: exodeoxyribonuclease V subunit gamma [Desulfobacterales bacterium]|jgi:exodeoxyribonuclease V gamma subunit|nr:exodeoxyribonuclease V subunit gamma [Desulfobacterales bacterium]